MSKGEGGSTPSSRRKEEHLRICLEREVEHSGSNGFENFRLTHDALPEVNLSEIDTSAEFLGKPFRLPFFIEAMTGGFPEAEQINLNLAAAARELGIGMGVGSQRAMLEDASLTRTYAVRDVAPSILLLGNIGVSQLARYTPAQLREAVDGIGADGLVVHLNPCQELCQPEGDTSWRGLSGRLGELVSSLGLPVVAKETGAGISAGVAGRLASLGVSALDVGGAGGTSWAKVEEARNGGKSPGVFGEWGIPTSASLLECRAACGLPLVASGGMRNGVEAAKALAMGATLVGFALPLLRPALESPEAVVRWLQDRADELRRTMFLVGAAELNSLRRVGVKRLQP